MLAGSVKAPARYNPMSDLEASLARGQAWIEPIGRMARATEIAALPGDIPTGAVQTLLDEATIVLPLAGLIDLAAERARLEKERAKAEDEAEKVRKKLGNADFVSRAKPEVVEENRERLAAAEAEISRLAAAVLRLQG